MLLVGIVGIVGVGAGIGLQSVAKTPEQTDLQLAINAQCVSVMEQMRATSFANLSTQAAALSGNMTIPATTGKTYACTVTVTAADADGDGTNDSDFERITVTMSYQGSAIETLTCYVMQP